MTHEPDLTLSRQDLYELVWSKPMVELAQDLGLSDVALAKRCRKLRVPVPGRGYWARVAAGQEPRQPKLTARDPEPMDVHALTFPAEREESPPEEVPAPVEAAIRVQIDAAPVALVAGLESALPPVQRLAHRHKVMPAKDIAWRRQADRHGPVLAIQVSESQARRALQIADTVLRAAESLGWPFEAVPVKAGGSERESPNPPIGALRVAGEPIALRIDEPQRRVEHVLTADERRRRERGQSVYTERWDYIWSGRLRLQVDDPPFSHSQRTWQDGKRQRLEDQIRDILTGLYNVSLHLKARREEHERWERARREEERRAAERSKRREAEVKLIELLERQAGAWFRARLLHRYIRAARRVLGDGRILAKRGSEPVDFFAWAQGYVDQLDPLHPAPRNSDLLPDRYAWRPDQEWKQSINRLGGFEGQESWKILGSTDDDGDLECEDDE